jgi:hypothetical protein
MRKIAVLNLVSILQTLVLRAMLKAEMVLQCLVVQPFLALQFQFLVVRFKAEAFYFTEAQHNERK